MMHRIKYADGKWDLKEPPAIDDVIVLYVGRKRHIMKVCRHIIHDNVCDSCAVHSVLRRRSMYCDTIDGGFICGVGSQNLQPYDMLEEL